MPRLGPNRKVASTHCPQHVDLHPSYPFFIQHEENSWKKTFRIVLPHVGLVTFCVIYVLAGAWIFFLIESSEEQLMRKKAENEIRSERHRLMVALWEEQRENRSAWEASALRHIDNTTRILISWFQRHYTADQQLTWSYPTAIFFCISMITTIGYGNLVPSTTEGQVICIIYGIFGIPLMLITVADAGKFIGDALRCLRRRGKVAGADGPLPVSALLFLMIAYMMIGAVLLHSYEKWTFGQAFYWAFISMSSIGFGDIVPERCEMFPVTIAYILVGLALASMCIDTSAAYYIRKIHFFGRKMKSAQATVSDLIRLSLFIKRRYRLSEKEMNEMSLQSALKHMLAACNAYVPDDINLIYYIDHPSSAYPPSDDIEEMHSIDE
ncbi:TWiK family of potassium channels protein 7 [Toxocara canis]|uniref:TWiK family of potassium channels protein 7 n=1 Tax=Toxocara canis TaxID=6265 RepID=A0A0B2UWQ5_TOXCA|nr:TWiK family of potassium channels protein 7 [Toxocara canis]